MAERDIPTGEWEAFIESFGMEHNGWVVNIEQHDQNGVPTDVEHDMVLNGIFVVPGEGDKSGIFITLTKETDIRRTHHVTDPVNVRLEESVGGTHNALTIESADGRLTELHLRPPQLPDRLKVTTEE